MSRRAGDAPYPWPNEDVIVELDGVISGYSRWSGISGLGAILFALLVPALLETSFVVGAIIVIGIITTVFVGVYYLVGRPLAAKADPPTESPYLRLVLTNKRVLLFDRGLGGEGPDLVEEVMVSEVNTVRFESATMLRPHRLRYAIDGNRRRQLEFPRGQNARAFAAYFS